MESLNIQVATQYAIDVADDGQPGLERRSPDVFGKDTTSDGIDDQVGAVLFGGGHDVVRKVSCTRVQGHIRSEEHTSELQSLMRISYAVFCLKKKTKPHYHIYFHNHQLHHHNITQNAKK